MAYDSIQDIPPTHHDWAEQDPSKCLEFCPIMPEAPTARIPIPEYRPMTIPQFQAAFSKAKTKKDALEACLHLIAGFGGNTDASPEYWKKRESWGV